MASATALFAPVRPAFAPFRPCSPPFAASKSLFLYPPGPNPPQPAMTEAPQATQAALGAALAVCMGAALGALARWQLGVALNHLHPALPPGTLLANVVGGYLVGVAVAAFALAPGLPPAWRLFVITGFLGGLTTFSTFSAEVVALLQAGRWWAGLTAMGAHLAGSLLATAAGLWTVHAVRGAP